MDKLLIVLLKQPILGKVKTRLAKGLGEAAALEVYQKLVDHTLKMASNGDWALQLHWAPNVPNEYQEIEAEQFTQQGQGLGARMTDSMKRGLERYEKVVLIGSDLPGISTGLIRTAFDHLSNADLVFGPSDDGGYYLVGMKTDCTEVFALEEFSHDRVFEDTIAIAHKRDWSIAKVDTLFDIDTYEDLNKWRQLQRAPFLG